MFEPMLATVRGRQGELFAEPDEPATSLRCEECGRLLVRTPSGYLACPRGHGKLLTEAVTEPEGDEDDDEPTPPHPWPVEARLIAKRHAARDNWHGRRWHCRCGACRRARLDGFIPREGRR
jgi:hypothetical protein